MSSPAVYLAYADSSEQLISTTFEVFSSCDGVASDNSVNWDGSQVTNTAIVPVFSRPSRDLTLMEIRLPNGVMSPGFGFMEEK